MMLDMYASAPADVVYAVTYRFFGGSSWTLHRTLASATGKVGGILGQAPGEWYRCEGEYRWKRRGALPITDGHYEIVVEEREVLR